MRLILLGLMALSFTRPSSAQAPNSRFWAWFQAHESALYAVRTGTEPICQDLARELKRIDQAVTFEFGPVEGGQREFVLSADGIREAFPAVIALSKAAPPLKRWRIITFRPPRPDVTRVDVAGIRLDAADVLFLAEADQGRTSLTLAVPGYHETENHAFEQAGYLLLDGLLGEYGVETGIGGITFIDATARPAGNWQPLTRLSQVVVVPRVP